MPNYSISSQVVDPGHPFTIALIGAGGTGSQILSHLARLHKSLIAVGKMGLHVTLWDGDKVTEANMGRQLFTKSDIGEYKSTVLIERINRFFGMFWESRTENVKEDSKIYAKMILSCVDNVASRRIIKDLYLTHVRLNLQYKSEFWLDTGNDLNTGQVILGSKTFKLPHILEVHPKMTDTGNTTPSCSVAEALGKQDMFINSAIALEAGKLVWDITYHGIIKWSRCYINFDRQACVLRNKLISDDPSKVQVHSERTGRAADKGKQKAKARPKSTATRSGVRSNTKSSVAKTGKAKKGILRNGKRASKVRRGGKGRISPSNRK